MPLLTTEKDIRDLINRDPDASKVAQTFFDALKPVGNKVAAEIGKLMLQGQPIPGGVDAGGALVAAGFRMAGASEQEAGLGAAVGKFAILSAARLDASADAPLVKLARAVSAALAEPATRPDRQLGNARKTYAAG